MKSLTPRGVALRNITATFVRPLGLVLAVVAATAPACSDKKKAADDEDGRNEGGAPGSGGSGGTLCVADALSCEGRNLVTCNADGTGYSSIVDCSPLTCVEDDIGPTCGADPGGGGTGGTGGATGGSGGSGGTGGASGGSGGATGGSGGGGSGGKGGSGTGGASGGTGGATGGSSGTGGDAGSDAGEPCATTGLFLCDCVPGFGATEQTLDGAGDEFVGIPPMTFEVSELPYLSRSATVPARVTVRAAWADDAFVAHVHVVDPAILPDSGATLWNGDSVQFFLAGTGTLTGTYSGTQDGGATHIIIAPTDGVVAARGITIYEPCYACVMSTALPTTVYAARTVADGYEVEVRMPWAATAEPRVSGAHIGLNLMFGVANTPGAGLELEGAMRNDPTLASESCSPTPTTHPGCDDRTWCTPRLE
jgi:hypothetical protein